MQLLLFAELRMSHIDFMDETDTVIRHKFLKNWNGDRDTLIYPPSSSRYSVFTGTDIIDQLAFMVTAVSFSFFAHINGL